MWLRLKMLFSAVSQVINILTAFDLGDTGPNESVSARMHRQGNTKRGKFINALFFFQPDHCRKAHLSDVYDAVALIAEVEAKGTKNKRVES